MGNSSRKIDCLTANTPKGKLFIENNEHLFITKEMLFVNKLNWIEKDSILQLFIGNTYGLGTMNEHPFYVVLDYDETLNSSILSKLWYIIDADKVKKL